MATSTYVLAFDFGGTKLAAAVVDIVRGKILLRVHRETPAREGAKASLDVICRAGEEVIEQLGLESSAIQSIGISFGGPISPDRRLVLRSMHVKAWDMLPLPQILADHFGKPAYMDNDANAAALGEWVFGAGKGTENFLYVQISTGVGSGLILERRVYRGAGLAGEFGHFTVLPKGPRCTCGKRGCIESLASGWAIAREGVKEWKRGRATRLGELAGNNPRRITAKLVFQAALEGDEICLEIIRRALHYLSMGVANAICLIDPEVIAIGGGMTRNNFPLLAEMEPQIENFLPPMLRNRTRLALAMNQGDETLIGAALLTQEEANLDRQVEPITL